MAKTGAVTSLATGAGKAGPPPKAPGVRKLHVARLRISRTKIFNVAPSNPLSRIATALENDALGGSVNVRYLTEPARL